MRVQGTGVCRSLDKILELPFEILWKKDKREIDVEDEDWAAAEEEHRESAVIGMTALSIGKIKVHIFWDGHKILRNLHLTFVICNASQK